MGNAEAKAAAEARFHARLTQLGVTLLEPYQGRHHPHQARCAAGHECSPRPGDVLKGGNPCGSCAGRSSAWSETRFRARLAELGGELLEPSWLGTHARHRVRCAAGHECHPRPNDVLRGTGVCRTCSGQDPAVAEARFRTRLARLGATLLEPYHGSGAPHRVRCAAGHECCPRPHSLSFGQGHVGYARAMTRPMPRSHSAPGWPSLAER